MDRRWGARSRLPLIRAAALRLCVFWPPQLVQRRVLETPKRRCKSVKYGCRPHLPCFVCVFVGRPPKQSNGVRSARAPCSRGGSMARAVSGVGGRDGGGRRRGAPRGGTGARARTVRSPKAAGQWPSAAHPPQVLLDSAVGALCHWAASGIESDAGHWAANSTEQTKTSNRPAPGSVFGHRTGWQLKGRRRRLEGH